MRPALLGLLVTTLAMVSACAQPIPPRKPLAAVAESGAAGGSCRGSGFAIVATPLPPIDDAGACGIEQPFRVEQVAGVTLSPPATLRCETATALGRWLRETAQPAARTHLGQEISGLRVAASYVCRGINRQPGARLSQHALGRAIDISRVSLAGGESVGLPDAWGAGGGEQAFIQALWRGACGPFTTVLGPDSDRFHQDHLHFDVKPRRSPYCR